MERLKEKAQTVLRTGVFYLRTKKVHISYVAGALFAVLCMAYLLLLRPPHDFATNTIITVPEGSSLSQVANLLEENSIIRSPLSFRVVATLTGNQTTLQAGDYYFHKKEGMFTVLGRLTEGAYDLTPITVRISEGATIFDIAEKMDELFAKFDSDVFVDLATREEAEGFLFPDTYSFPPNIDAERAYRMLRENFDKRTKEVFALANDREIPVEDAIVMASIIEKESADDFEERRTISGILWNRIDIGMPLQVDAAFGYINGKGTFDLTEEDLEIDSPYNTYVYPGLPAGPIGNPSLESIKAALDPKETDYLFYLHGLDGNIYYAEDFEEHKKNKFRYLR